MDNILVVELFLENKAQNYSATTKGDYKRVSFQKESRVYLFVFQSDGIAGIEQVYVVNAVHH